MLLRSQSLESLPEYHEELNRNPSSKFVKTNNNISSDSTDSITDLIATRNGNVGRTSNARQIVKVRHENIDSGNTIVLFDDDDILGGDSI